ncbi:BTB/POZ and MATH domain-containing protein 4-like [Salvia splendens]|uniref:BTB/POZ and MATH domain-containing protein 4-like n=1 Tax=Salvia splendens TaxID=180675 RepID=UPI001C270825|nr:BTB/POZ and MATH domain-containing protein 4-like [Salvia splendens]
MWGYKRFFRRAMLETSDFLRDDCLKINCTVGVVVSATDCSMLHSIQVPDSDIESNIGMLLENMEGSDIIFNVSGEKFHAHKLVLSARSPKFRSELLEGVDIEVEEVMVPDMEPKVFKALLHFIYRDTLAEDELIASSSCSTPLVAYTLTAKLLAAADHYDLERLKRICESHLCKDISVDSVTQVLSLADSYHAAELKDVCLKFATENLADPKCSLMPKRGRPLSQASEAAEKRLKSEIDNAVDDVIPVAFAKKLRDRLAEGVPSTSASDVEQKTIKRRKTDRLYCRRTPSEFLNCLKQLNPRQKRAVTEIGFRAVLSFDIKEIPSFLAFWVLNALNLACCQI